MGPAWDLFLFGRGPTWYLSVQCFFISDRNMGHSHVSYHVQERRLVLRRQGLFKIYSKICEDPDNGSKLEFLPSGIIFCCNFCSFLGLHAMFWFFCLYTCNTSFLHMSMSMGAQHIPNCAPIWPFEFFFLVHKAWGSLRIVCQIPFSLILLTLPHKTILQIPQS